MARKSRKYILQNQGSSMIKVAGYIRLSVSKDSLKTEYNFYVKVRDEKIEIKRIITKCVGKIHIYN